MSIIYDNRSRISTRIKQFHTGKRHSQTPPSNLRRVVSNVELLGERDGDAEVCATFICVESRERGDHDLGRTPATTGCDAPTPACAWPSRRSRSSTTTARSTHSAS